VPKLLSVVSADEVPTLPAGKIAKRELAAMLRRRAGGT
jgi:acyl-CoA synthetase (AMP-forming)/AMP-acid ligase II